MKRESGTNGSSKVWMAFGGLMLIGIATLLIRELPAMRRELRIMRM